MSGEDPRDALAPLVGEWVMAPDFPGMPPSEAPDARVSFTWLPGERFLMERWELPGLKPPAPNAPIAGIAIIGPDPENEGQYLQHYFDSRGVARVYQMSLTNGAWKLWREQPDFSPLDFAQRFTGVFSDDGRTISGAWDICRDGRTWETDFPLIYTKVNGEAPTRWR